MSEAFQAAVRWQSGRATLDLSGDIDAFAEQSLQSAYDEAERRSPQLIVLNFSAARYINSTGIALIVGLLARARKSHTRLAAYGLSDHYVEIFQITRLADFMPVYPDEAGASAAS